MFLVILSNFAGGFFHHTYRVMFNLFEHAVSICCQKVLFGQLFRQPLPNKKLPQNCFNLIMPCESQYYFCFCPLVLGQLQLPTPVISPAFCRFGVCTKLNFSFYLHNVLFKFLNRSEFWLK